MIRISVLEQGPGNSRLLSVEAGKKRLMTPAYFPAISRKEIRDPDSKFLALVATSKYPRLLVSAYDYGRVRTSSERKEVGRLRNYWRGGSVLMLDSGVFESYWREDHLWSFQKYRESIKNITSDFFLSFDILPQEKRSNPAFRRLTANGILKSSRLANESNCIPIVHGTSPSQLVRLVSDMTRGITAQFSAMAVSERELGNTISERCSTIMKIRMVLNRYSGGVLHILGCGQPLSMAFYVYSGADTFDSLDWAIAAFDPVAERMIDLSHFELLSCKCQVCKDPNIDSFSRVYLHNLLQYQEYCIKLHMMIRNGTLIDYLQASTNKQFLVRLHSMP